MFSISVYRLSIGFDRLSMLYMCLCVSYRFCIGL